MRHALSSGGLLATVVLAGCGTAIDGEPEPAAPGTTAEPTTAPSSQPAATPELCEQVYTAVEQAKALHPQVEVMATALDRAASTAAPELLPEIDTMASAVDEYAEVLADNPPLVVPNPALVPGEELTDACAAVGTDLDDVPTPAASVEEICTELHLIADYQDPQGWDLDEIEELFTDRATTYAPPELAHGVYAYTQRIRSDGAPENEDDRLARLHLSDICVDLGLPLLHP